MGVKAKDVAHVRFQAPDLDLMERFLVDFGMSVAHRDDDTLYMNGADGSVVHVTHRGDEPRFIGFAFEAETATDLKVLAARDDFSAVEPLDGPAGGAVVSSVDPNGFQVEVVAGRTTADHPEIPTAARRNDVRDHPRIGEALRLANGPAQVHRLGHCVLDVVDFRASEAWYKERFGLITSDEIAIDEQRALGAFLRCDQGDRYVDHHTLFLVDIGRARFNHAAFEVADFDDLMRGHTHLVAAGHTHQWGIGRHILGSQIYDYWLDPHGHMVEHWTDGDLFNNHTPPTTAPVETLLGSQWGPTSGAPPA